MNSDHATLSLGHRTDFPRWGFLAASLLIGCSDAPEGPPRAAVSGVVHLEGAPLANGTIRFVPIKGTPGPKVSVPITGGRFEVAARYGPVVGINRVEIESTDGPAFDDEQQLAELQASPRQISVFKVPPAYNTCSQLQFEIKLDAVNHLSYDLKMVGPR